MRNLIKPKFSSQLDIFSQNKICSYCKKTIPPNPYNPLLVWGFRDAKTDQLVCQNCRIAHYEITSVNIDSLS